MARTICGADRCQHRTHWADDGGVESRVLIEDASEQRRSASRQPRNKIIGHVTPGDMGLSAFGPGVLPTTVPELGPSPPAACGAVFIPDA